MYWNLDKVLSYNCLFNFILGARGVGKTYGLKKYVIKQFLKKEKQFIYVRRFKEEIKAVGDKFFSDIYSEFPEHSLEFDKSQFLIDKKVAGYTIPLTTASIRKSVPYPNVSYIIFDEFIIETGVYHYLNNEVTKFLELYSTVARLRDDVQVFFLSNAITFTNPYFIYFDLNKPFKNDIVVKNDILLQVIDNEEYSNTYKETRFGKMLAGTQYADYAMDNQFLQDNNDFLMKKTSRCKYMFGIKYKNEVYGVWSDSSIGVWFVSNDIDKTSKLLYSALLEDHTTNTMLIKSAHSNYFKIFIKNFQNGLVMFESLKIKNLMIEMLRRFI